MRPYGGSPYGVTMALALASDPVVLLISYANKSLKFGASVSLENASPGLL